MTATTTTNQERHGMSDYGAFRKAVEAYDLPALVRTLDDDVEFDSPVMPKPYRGRDKVATFLGVLMEVFEDFHYTDELAGYGHRGQVEGSPADGSPTQALIFNARVMGKAVQGLDLLTFNEAGLVTRLTVMVRPLPAAMTLARVVGQKMEELSASA